MQRDSRAYLWDIQQATDAILRFVAGLDAKIYRNTDVVHSAVERKFEIIGEALSQLSKANPALARRIPDVRQIIAFRNLLIHGYAAIDHDRAWRIATSSIPGLQATVAALMDDLGRSSEPNHTDLNDDVRRRAFARYIGVDYSGANTPTKSLKGLRVYCADVDGPPREVTPPTSPRKYWTRRGVAEWLGERLAEDIPTIVGIDHGFSFPEEYFDKYGLKGGWDEFLHDFHLHWQTDDDDANVKSLLAGNARVGDPRWKRLTERRAKDLCNRSAKSVFQFGVQGSVAHSTHAGIPWLIRIRTQLGPRVHFWPFDGWQVPSGRSAVVEVYPALWHRGQQEVVGLSDDQRDAYCIAMWLSDADRFGELAGALEPNLSPDDRALAGMEGWILGVPGSQG